MRRPPRVCGHDGRGRGRTDCAFSVYQPLGYLSACPNRGGQLNGENRNPKLSPRVLMFEFPDVRKELLPVCKSCPRCQERATACLQVVSQMSGRSYCLSASRVLEATKELLPLCMPCLRC